MDRLAQLESENKALREKIKTLDANCEAALANLEKQLAIEKRYEESQVRFRTIFEQSKFGNKIITSDLRIIQVNKALQMILGYSEKELVGTKIIAYAHPDFVKPWQELQKKLWAEKIPFFGIEACLIKKDGSTIWCNVTSILFQEDGNSLGYTIVEDITERKMVEEKLQKLYDSQETIMHMIAHDLKNPIHIIKTLSGFLKSNIASLQASEPEKKNQNLSFIASIEDTCENAYSVIKDLLIIGEIESGKSILEKQGTEMKSFIEDQLPYFQIDAQEKGIEIKLHFPQEEVYAQINGEKMKRVIGNLLSNAIKFTHVGGQVSISLKREAQQVILQVSDTGIGIPEELKSSVFHKFTKANRQGTQGETTTGLGLFIAKQIIELHGGKIWFESKENQGTSFYVELT